MSRIAKAPEWLQAYRDDLRAYELRFAAWLGIDPHEVSHLTEEPIPDDPFMPARLNPFISPPALRVAWESFDKAVGAEEHRGRHPLPVGVRGHGDGSPSVVTNTVILDWAEVDRLRAEVGERPKFPAPEGGWPTRWPVSD